MRAATRAKLVAASLLALFLLTVAVLLADWYVGAAYRHVVIEVSNVDDTARIDVNCRRVLVLDAGEGTETADLGWLRPQDRVYVSEYNERGGAAWGFKVMINGEEKHDFSDGHAGMTGQGAGPYGVAMAEAITADGVHLGTLGCAQHDHLVSDSLVDYQQAPEMVAMEDRGEEPPDWDAPRFPQAQIEDVAVPLAVIVATFGVVLALCTARVRRLIRRHRFISFAFGALNLFLGLTQGVGLEALLFWYVGVGLLLLLVSGVVAVWPHTGSCCLTSCSTPDPKPSPE